MPDIVETVATLPRNRPEGPGGRPLADLSWLLAWGTKGGLAITDQALFAGAQFALNICLARWLTALGYGIFAVAYSVYLLASAAHNALLVEPMVVFGSGRYLAERKSYLGVVLRGHTLLMIPTASIFLGAGLVAGLWDSTSVAPVLYGLGLALPLTLLSELTRRAFYVEMRPGRAAVGGAIYFCSLLLLIVGLRSRELLTPLTAILAMGAAALVTSSVQLAWLGSHWPRNLGNLSARNVASEHWAYGRWVLASALPSWTFPNLFYLLLPLRFGLKESGALKAILNLAMPAAHALIAIGLLAIPLFVRHLNAGGLTLLRQTVWRITSLFAAGSAAYLVVLWIFRIQIVHLLYGGKFLEYSRWPVFVVGLVPIATALSVSAGAALRALERPDCLFWANVAASLIAVSLGLYLTLTAGLLGAIVGHVASYAVYAGVMWFFFRGLLHRRGVDRWTGGDGGGDAPKSESVA